MGDLHTLIVTKSKGLTIKDHPASVLNVASLLWIYNGEDLRKGISNIYHTMYDKNIFNIRNCMNERIRKDFIIAY